MGDFTIRVAIDLLRGRLRRLKGRSSMDLIAPACGVHVQVLRDFLNGKAVNAATLFKIETWCDQEEQSRANSHHA